MKKIIAITMVELSMLCNIVYQDDTFIHNIREFLKRSVLFISEKKSREMAHG